MEEKRKPFLKRAEDFLSGKGFYIVLSVCIVIIGVSAWILLSSGGAAGRTDVDDSTASAQITAPERPVSGRNSGAKAGASSEKTETPDTGDGETEPSGGGTGETYSEDAPDAVATMGTDDTEPATDVSGDAEDTQGDPGPAPSFSWPVNGSIAAPYAKDSLIYSKTMMDWRTHDGVDISAAIGTKVRAAADGTVERVYSDDLMGTTVVMSHSGGYGTVYSNLASSPAVSEGDTITMGTVIGSVGDTALGETGEVTHLHFSVTCGGESVDPEEILP